TRGPFQGQNLTLANPFQVTSGTIWDPYAGFTFTGPGTLSGNLMILGPYSPPPGVVTFSGSLSGPGGITMNRDLLADFTVVLAGTAANTYSGTTRVNGGTLVLQKPAGVKAIAGPLVIGDGVGGAKADVVSLAAANQIADTVPITLNSSGLL